MIERLQDLEVLSDLLSREEFFMGRQRIERVQVRAAEALNALLGALFLRVPKVGMSQTQTTIAVEEGANGLELGVRQADLDEHWLGAVGVEETFEIGKRLRHFVQGRRHEGRFPQRASGRADPVLRGAQLARRDPPAAHQLGVDLAD
jgi:hypothetical protein